MILSIVSPIYKGEKMLDELVRRITASVTPITDEYEIILVNDQSPDDSWNVIKRICKKDKHVKGVNLSRNFGQHYAISAGLSLVQGDWIVVLDWVRYSLCSKARAARQVLKTIILDGFPFGI